MPQVTRQSAVPLLLLALLTAAVPVHGDGELLTLPDDALPRPVAVTASGSAGAVEHDDAGSGRDAGDARNQALPLPQAGRYMGNMSPSASDTDWFEAPSPTSGFACAEALVQTAGQAVLTLARGGDDAATMSVRTPHGGPQALAFAFPAAPGYLGVRPAGPSQQTVAPYRFAFDVADAETVPRPVPGTNEASAPAVDYGCLGGTYGGQPAFYALDVRADRAVTVTFAGGAELALVVLDQEGMEAARLESGDIRFLHAAVDGTWHLVVDGPVGQDGTAGSDTVGSTNVDAGDDYTIGTSESDDPPATNGCRPNCESTLALS